MIYILLFSAMGILQSQAIDPYPLEEKGSKSHVPLNVRISNSLLSQQTFNQPLKDALESDVKKIAIIDTGFNFDHSQFKDRFADGFCPLNIGLSPHNNSKDAGEKFQPGDSFLSWSKEDREILASKYNHGTHMASLVAQVSGGLPEGHKIKIVPIKVGIDPLEDLNYHIHALNFIAERSDIAVVSISINYPIIFYCEPTNINEFKSALLNVVNSGKVIFLAALNKGRVYKEKDPFVEFVLSPEVGGRIIVVGATSRTPEGEEIIAGYSNQAGALSPQFLVASGTSVPCAFYMSSDGTIKHTEAFELSSGTSHATAITSGGFIYLINQFPSLPIDSAIKIAFESASKNFQTTAVKRSRKIYGHGQLNLDKARLLAATHLLHQKNDGFYQSNLPVSKIEREEQSSLVSPTFPLLTVKSYQASSWGTFIKPGSKKSSTSTTWLSNQPCVSRAVLDEKVRRLEVVIPDSIAPVDLLTQNLLNKHANVLYYPSRHEQAPDGLSSKTSSSSSIDKRKFLKPFIGEKETSAMDVDGVAFAYTVSINENDKLLYVQEGHH